MKRHKKYKLIIEDESRLQTLAAWSLSPIRIAGLLAGAILLTLVVGYLFVLLTPVKTLIPGYFRESQREASQEALLRVDSLMDAFRRNEAYLMNLKSVFDIDRNASDSLFVSQNTTVFSPDSLLPPSAEEAKFVKMMQEREKFNINVKASMSAEGMLFYPVSDEGVVTMASRNSYQARIALPAKSSVMAIADGSVLARYYDQSSRGYVIILQHDNGFVSRYAGLGNLLVGQSEAVNGGQVLADSPIAAAGRPAEISVELWHNGIHLKPYEYISSHHLRRAASTSSPDEDPDSDFPE